MPERAGWVEAESGKLTADKYICMRHCVSIPGPLRPFEAGQNVSQESRNFVAHYSQFTFHTPQPALIQAPKLSLIKVNQG